MLILGYDLRVTSPPCDPGTERWSAFASLPTDISAVLPYLNTQLKGCIYDHYAQVLTWRTKGHVIAIRPREIAISNLEDREQARAAVDEIIALINTAWDRRSEIEPSYHKRERPSPLAIYKLLPGSNCKLCGEPTCFTFATKLALGTVELSRCQPLFEETQREKRAQLLTLLESAA